MIPASSGCLQQRFFAGIFMDLQVVVVMVINLLRK